MQKSNKNKILINKIVFFAIGMLVMTFGSRMLLYSAIGTSAMDALSVGVSQIVGLSIGLSINIVGVCLVLISSLLRKSKINIYPILTSCVFGLLYDMWSVTVFNNLPEVTGFINQMVVLLVAILLAAVGTAIYIIPKFPVSTLDYFMLSIQIRFKTSLQTSRIIMEAVLTIAAFFIGGPVGLGTFIILIIFGPILQICHTYIEKLINKSNLVFN